MQALVACCPIARREALEAMLLYFPKQNSLPERFLPRNTPPPTAGQADWKEWHEQQLQKLTTLVKHNPLVFLKGEPGAGKSWSATKVAQRLNPNQEPVTMTAGPQSEQLQLLRKPVIENYLNIDIAELENLNLYDDDNDGQALEAILKEHGIQEGNRYSLPLTPPVERALKQTLSSQARGLLGMFRDTRMHYEDGPLLKWAKTPSVNGNPVVLIIDEANLAPSALWDIFQGLGGPKPSLCFGGQCLPLTAEHRIIMTGNPETASGRESSLNLRCQAATLYYPPLPNDFLKHCILQPRLETMNLDLKQQTWISEALVTLWQRFKDLTPEHEFTPRDIHEICDRLDLYLALEEQAQAQQGKTVSEPTSDAILFQLAWLSVSETLGGGCHTAQEALTSLYQWSRHAFMGQQQIPVVAADQNFYALLLALQNSDGFCSQGKSVEQLARVYWCALNKRRSEKERQQVFAGKHATLVEGPAGRGKDALLHQVCKQTRTPYVHLNAGSDDWQNIREALQKAALNGEVVVISELNLLPSQYLEGELNDILTGAAKPGFHLFATVNPPEFSGRERLSSALQSRFVTCTIGDYSDKELDVISSFNTTMDTSQRQQIVSWHCRLRHLIQSQGASTLSPGTSTLLALLNHLQSSDVVISQDVLRNSFNSLYRIPMDYAGVDLEQLEKLENRTTAIDLSTENHSLALMNILYQCIHGLSPITLHQGGLACHYNARTGQLRVPDAMLQKLASETSADLSSPVLREIVLSVITGIWKYAGMPERYPDPGDKLACNLYTEWQRLFAQQLLIDKTYKDACLSQWYPQPEPGASAGTMNLEENQKVIKEVRGFIRRCGTKADPVMYRQFLMTLAPWRAAFEEVKSTTEEVKSTTEEVKSTTKNPDKAMDVVIARNQDEQIDTLRKTKPGTSSVSWSGGTISAFTYDGDGISNTATITPTFQGCNSKTERVRTLAPLYIPEKGMLFAHNIMGTGGFNRVICQPLPFGYKLPVDSTPGRQCLALTEEQWQPLAGITHAPKAAIQFISIDPPLPFEVIQDRASGFNLIRLLPREGDKADRNPHFVTVRFVLDATKGISPTDHGQLSACVHSCACPKDIDDVISTHTDPDIIQLRDNIEAAQTQQERLKIINAFCTGNRYFTSSVPLIQTENKAKMVELLTVRPSTSECRAMAYWMLASWCRIPVRFSSTLVNGSVAETSTDGGYTFSAECLQGYRNKGTKFVDMQQEFPGIIKKTSPDVLDLIDTDSADAIADALKTVTSTQGQYHMLSLLFGSLAGEHISLSGPVSLDLVKEWLQEFAKQKGARSFREKPEILCGLMANIDKRREKRPSEELNAIYHNLATFIMERGWMGLGSVGDIIHVLQPKPENAYRKKMSFTAKFSPTIWTPTMTSADPDNPCAQTY